MAVNGDILKIVYMSVYNLYNTMYIYKEMWKREEERETEMERDLCNPDYP